MMSQQQAKHKCVFLFPNSLIISFYFFHYLPFQHPLNFTPTARSGCGLYSLVVVNLGLPCLHFDLSLPLVVVRQSRFAPWPLPFLHAFTAHTCRLLIAYTLTTCDVFVRACLCKGRDVKTTRSSQLYPGINIASPSRRGR